MTNPDPILTDLLANDRWMRQLARRLVEDDHAADDVVQTAWVRFLEKPPQYSRTRPWLRRVVTNAANMRRRSETKRAEREARTARSDPIPSVAELYDRESTRHRVAMAVFRLEEPYRSAILQRYFEGLSPRQIAARHDLSTHAVEGRLRRGLEKLRGRLDRAFGDREQWRSALVPMLTVPVGATMLSSVGGILMAKTNVAILAILVVVAVIAVWPKTPDAPHASPTERTEVVNASATVASAAAEPEPPAPAVVSDTSTSTAPTRAPVAEPAVHGEVRSQNGNPIDGAEIRAYYPSPGDIDAPVVARAETGPDGRFSIGPIDARCLLVVSAANHHGARRWVTPPALAAFVLGNPGSLTGAITTSPDGAPYNGATVLLYRVTDGDRLDDWLQGRSNPVWAALPVARAQTSDDGRYRFDGLRAADYRLRIVARGRADHFGSTDITVRTGETATRDVALSVGARIVGRVVDRDTGMPIRDASLRLTGSSRDVATTDDEGRFDLGGLPTRMLLEVLVSAPGYRDGLVDISARSTADTLDKTVRLRRSIAVSGTVVRADGTPVGGARVGPRARGVTHRDLDVNTKFAALSVVETDDAGRFTIPLGDTAQPRRLVAAKVGVGFGIADPIVVRRGEPIDDVRIVIGEASLAGRITDDTGQAVEGAKVILLDNRHAMLGEAHSDSGGQYRLASIAPGTYDVVIAPPGLGDGDSPYEWTRREQVVVSASVPTSRSFVLQRGAVVRGRVVDDLGRPVPEAVVRCMPQIDLRETLSRYDGRREHARVVATDESGQFAIRGLDRLATSYVLQTTAAGHGRAILRDVEPGRTDLLITVSRTVPIRGRVTMGNTRAPATHYTLYATATTDATAQRGSERMRTKRFARNMSTPTGAFEWSLPPDTYFVHAVDEAGGASEKTTVEVLPEAPPQPVHLVIRTAATVTGRVRDGLGRLPKYVGQAHVVAYRLGAKPERAERGRVNDSGAFSITGLQPGRYALWVHVVDRDLMGLYGLATVEVSGGTPSSADLIVRRPVDVSVRVVTADGRGIANASVAVRRTDALPIARRPTTARLNQIKNPSLRSRQGRSLDPNDIEREYAAAERRCSTTDAAGNMGPLQLVPGRYVLEASLPDGGTVDKTVDVRSGTQVTLQAR